MTDRYNSYLVVLESDTRDDDSEATITALKMIKGVKKVTPLVADPQESVGEYRERDRVTKIITKALRDTMSGVAGDKK